jgi:hypothetical protein
MKVAMLVVWTYSALAQSTIVVTVQNEKNQPLAGAFIDHVGGAISWGSETDPKGKASVILKGSKAVVRLRGYESALIALGDKDQTVTLRATNRTAQQCATVARGVNTFVLPETPEISRFQGASDIDFKTTVYEITVTGLSGWWYRNVVRPRHLPDNVPQIVYGKGPNWSRGAPRLDLVTESVQFEEVTIPMKGFWYVDAHGTKPDGTRWRFMGNRFETISYKDVSPADAELFDRFLARLCVSLLPQPVK